MSSSFCCCFLISKGQVFLGKPDTEVVCLSSDSEKEDDGIPEEDMEMLESRDRKGEDEIKGDRIHLVAGVEDNKWGREKLPRCLVCRMSDSYEMWAPATLSVK